LYLAQAKQAQGDNTAATSLLQQAQKIANDIHADDLIAAIKKAQQGNE
jgi:cell fate (sporulation/competence/biofilm development) regulator YlbF (YheA/YmcA/DUF963 family)